MMPGQKITFGIDSFLEQVDRYKNLRVAMITNNAATTSDGKLSRKALLKKGLSIQKLFSPEHGIHTVGEDGVVQYNSIDTETGLPIISLYGDHLMPQEEELDNIDLVIFDIPDIGCRFYTYLWTMTYVMEACAKFSKALLILDRPNPIGGDFSKAEGPLLDEMNCSSFIGRWSIPIRHSCTLGELALYFTKYKLPGIPGSTSQNLQVIKAEGWDRNQSAEEAGWLFVPTSPAIQNVHSVHYYPGTGLFEGINVNEGRGTSFPFQLFGAPWIDPGLLQNAFQELNLPGIQGEAISYTPIDGFYRNEKCHGLRLRITDNKIFRPVMCGLEIIHMLCKNYGDVISERKYKTHANPSGARHLDRLSGVHDCFAKLKRGENISTNLGDDWYSKMESLRLY